MTSVLRLDPQGRDEGYTAGEGHAAASSSASEELSELIFVDLPPSSLAPGVSPRLEGIRHEHVEVLAEQSANWPPIAVTHVGFKVIDGQHRVRAAILLKQSTIRCELVDVCPDDVFAEAVKRNILHGLPLTMKDRKHAGTVLLIKHPDWADRRIAAVCGLSHHTIASLRSASPSGQNAQSGKREGLDGRRRRVTSLKAVDSQPEVGSPEEVESPKIASSIGRSAARTGTRSERPFSRIGDACATDAKSAHRRDELRWSSDAALSSTDSGPRFVEWFERTGPGEAWGTFAELVPLSRVYEVADEARRRAQSWQEFANLVEERVRRMNSQSITSAQRDAPNLVVTAISQRSSRGSAG